MTASSTRRHTVTNRASSSLPTTAAGGTGEWLDPGSAETDDEGKICWYDIRALGVEGQGWNDIKEPYDRLPAKAEGLVRDPVWNLSRHSAGLCVRFVTAAASIHARWGVRSESLAMNHMPATGVSGLDLYVRTETGAWHWLGTGRPESRADNKSVLATGIPPGEREYILYLPLYNGTVFARIGIPADARIGKAAPRPEKRQQPVVFYGTSITQGGCASRPGMVHTAILGRHLEIPVINLGFSGNGKMEPEIAELLAELDPAVYVLDCLPNMVPSEVAERVEPFVHILRKAHPETPILLVEDRSYGTAFLLPATAQRNRESRAALRTAHANLVAAGVPGLSYLEGENLLGDDGEGTVDGSHPTDLGFVRQAAAFEAALAPLLGSR